MSKDVFTVKPVGGPIFLVKGITQVRTGDGVGQCTEATYATILGAPLSAIPDLFTGDPDNPRSPERWQIMHDYMRVVHGRAIISCQFKPRNLPLDINQLQEDLNVDLGWLPWETSLHGMMGYNPRTGIGHMLVGYMGKPMWDPNPERLGIDSCDGFTFLIKKKLVPKEVWDAGMGGMIWNHEYPEHRDGK